MRINTLFSRKTITAASAMLVACSGVVPAFGAPSVSKPHVPTFRKAAPASTTLAPHRPGQIIVEVNQSADSDQIQQELDTLGGKIIQTIGGDGCTVAVVQLDKTDDTKLMTALKSMSKDKKNFSLVQENRTYNKCSWPSSGDPDDTDLLEQPQYFKHNVLGAQESLSAQGKSLPISDPSYPSRAAVVIGLLDTGCEAYQNNTAMDFYPNQVLPGLNAVTGTATGNMDSDVSDLPPDGIGGHGSFCSGIMAAATNNDYNGAGFVPGAQIDPVDVFNGAATTSDADLLIGLKFLQKEPGVKYVNCSINGVPPYTLNADTVWLHAVAAYYLHTGGCVFNAAGNAGLDDNSPIYAPYGVDLNVVVSAVDSNGNLASFSNFGAPVLFAAIGVGDGSTNASGSFVNGDGTSFAAPCCTAMAAGIQWLHPKWKLLQVLEQMGHYTHSGVYGHPGFNNFGYGIPSFGQAIKAK
ncbi:MAG TPA: S8/S53 family peptidase [Planktothrix sp.]